MRLKLLFPNHSSITVDLERHFIMSFKIDQYFNTQYSRSINYKDPEINLNIEIDEKLISDQDKNAPF